MQIWEAMKSEMNFKNTNSHVYEYGVFAAIKPSMTYSEDLDFSAWQNAARKKLCELLGLPLTACDACLELEYVKKHDESTEYRFTVQTEPGYFVPCYLLLPNSVNKPVPLTVCLSGHGGGMHIALGEARCEADEKSLREWPHRAMGPRAVKEGRAALIIEARCFGESSLKGYGTSCTETAKIAILSGRTVIGERVSDAMRIISAVLSEFSDISEEGIMCTGNSGGGTATYYLACLDERIAVAAPSCSVCSYEKSIAAMTHCMCNHVPSIRRYFEMGDLGGLIAPRRLIVAAGQEDPIFPIDGVKDAYREIERLYKYAGAPEACRLLLGDGGHLNYADLIWDAFYEMR